MRLLRRNTTKFEYYAPDSKQETMANGLHAGNFMRLYADPVIYRGNISAPSGALSDNMYGFNTPYTHVLLMDDPDTDISEEGLIKWKRKEYEIMAVRPTINVLAVALKEKTGG